MLLSVIVPVYNVESYLRECVDSLLTQTFKSMEIILVDDGSTDKSGKICDEYAQKYSGVSSYHKVNGGLMSAWKYGVRHCHGDIVGFVDSDDWVDADMYDTLIEAFVENNVDIVVCGLVKGEYIYNQSSDYSGCYNSNELYPVVINNGTFMGRSIIPSRVVKIFRREIVENAMLYCDDNISMGEDMVMNFASLMFAERICFLKNFFPYHYRINPTSITQNFKPHLFDQALLFTDKLRCIARHESTYDFEAQINADMLSNVLNILEAACASKVGIIELRNFIKKVVNDSKVRATLKDIDISKWTCRYKNYFRLYSCRNVIGLILYGKIVAACKKAKKVIHK